ncbi:heat shock factor binding protein 1-domain-containing protein [Apiospora sp. TS-2023a]
MSSKKPEANNTANNNKEGTPSDELTVVVEELLNSLSNKFAGVSSEIFAKSMDSLPTHVPDGSCNLWVLMRIIIVDEMSRRLDNLESALKANQASDSASSSKP